MKQNSQLLAQILIVGFLGIAASSAYYANNFNKQNSALKVSAEEAKKELVVQQTLQQELAANLTPDQEPNKIEPTLIALVPSAYNSAIENQVYYTEFTLDSVGQGTQELSSSYQKIADTEANSIVLKVSGTYKNYAGLLNWIKDLQRLPISVSEFQVIEETFQLTIKVYGQ